MSNSRRFFLQTEEFEEPMIPFVLPVSVQHLTSSINRHVLSLTNLPPHLKDVMYALCFLCQRFDGKIYMLYNEPYMDGHKSMLDTHHRAAVCASVTFIFLLNRHRVCEVDSTDEILRKSNAPAPMWFDENSKSQFDESSMSSHPIITLDAMMETEQQQSDELFLPSNAHKNLSNAILDLLAVKIGVASYANIAVAPLRQQIRSKIDFQKNTIKLLRGDVKDLGGTYYSQTSGKSNGGGAATIIQNAAVVGLQANSLDVLLDHIESVSTNHITSQQGQVQIKVTKRSHYDANTLLWFRLKTFFAMHIWDSNVFFNYLNESVKQYLMSKRLTDHPFLSSSSVASSTTRLKRVEMMKSDPILSDMFTFGPLRIIDELAVTNKLKSLTVPSPADVIMFSYEHHELLRNGVLDGQLQGVPFIDMTDLDVKNNMRLYFNAECDTHDYSIETYAAVMTQPDIHNEFIKKMMNNTVGGVNTREYQAALWPHLYYIRLMLLDRQGTNVTNFLPIRNNLGLIDTAWAFGLNKASTLMKQLFNLYQKYITVDKNYTSSMGLSLEQIVTLCRWKCHAPAVACLAGIMTKLFASHIYVERCMQATVMFKIMLSATAPRWRYSKPMIINYTPTAHGKTRCNNILCILFESVPGFIVRKTSITPASFKYPVHDGDIYNMGSSVIFDDATISCVDSKNANDESSNISAILKNILDTSITVSNVAAATSASGSGDFKNKTITAIHNTQWFWNVNTIHSFSTAVMDRSLLICQQRRKRVMEDNDNNRMIIYGDRVDEETVINARLNLLTEKLLVRSHIHQSLVSLLCPSLLAPAMTELNQLYNILTSNLRSIFHNMGQVDKTRGLDKTVDIYAENVILMGQCHVHELTIPPYTPLRYPRKNETLYSYLEDVRCRVNKSNSFRTREDVVLETLCASILYTGPALVDAFNSVTVQSQGMHLSAMHAVIGFMKNRLSTLTFTSTSILITVNKSIFKGYYQLDEHSNQLQELTKVMFNSGQGRCAKLIVSMSNVKTEGAESDRLNIEFSILGLYKIACHLFEEEYARFDQWYNLIVSQLESRVIESQDQTLTAEEDMTNDNNLTLFFLKLRESLGYKVRLDSDGVSYTGIFSPKCHFFWYQQKQAWAREQLCQKQFHNINGSFMNVKDKHWTGQPIFVETLPFETSLINKECNVKENEQHVMIHWKCLDNDLLNVLDIHGCLFEGNYLQLMKTSENVTVYSNLSVLKPKMVNKTSFYGSKKGPLRQNQYLLWDTNKIAIYCAFVTIVPQPLEFFGKEFLNKSGFVHYCAPRTYSMVQKEEVCLYDFTHEPIIYQPYLITNGGQQCPTTFRTCQDGQHIELRQNWEYHLMAELYNKSTGKSVTPETIKDWNSCFISPPVEDVPLCYSQLTKSVKINPDLSDIKASTVFDSSHRIFSRMKEYYDNSDTHKWLKGEVPDWTLIRATVKTHYSCSNDTTQCETATTAAASTRKRSAFQFIGDSQKKSKHHKRGDDSENKTIIDIDSFLKDV